jgi:hypothetical protein
LEYIYAHQLKGLITGEYIHPNICADKHSLCDNVKKRNELEKHKKIYLKTKSKHDFDIFIQKAP